MGWVGVLGLSVAPFELAEGSGVVVVEPVAPVVVEPVAPVVVEPVAPVGGGDVPP